MGEAFLYGNGGGVNLNFKIVGGTTQPTTNFENTIWVNTNEKITTWSFSITEPSSPTPGMIWFVIGSMSQAGFNALKKNSINLQPNAAKQYISGEWQSKVAKTWQNGEWIDWAYYMFKSGYGFSDGFTGFQADWISENSYTEERIKITIYKDDGYHSNYFVSKEPIDLTDYSTAYLTGLTVSHYGASGYSTSIRYGFGKTIDSSGTDYTTYIDTPEPNGEYITNGMITIDIKDADGEYYLKGYFNCSDEDETNFTTRIENIYFI